jgi:hypothetical protein
MSRRRLGIYEQTYYNQIIQNLKDACRQLSTDGFLVEFDSADDAKTDGTWLYSDVSFGSLSHNDFFAIRCQCIGLRDDHDVFMDITGTVTRTVLKFKIQHSVSNRVRAYAQSYTPSFQTIIIIVLGLLVLFLAQEELWACGEFFCYLCVYAKDNFNIYNFAPRIPSFEKKE